MTIALLTDGFYPFTLGGIQKHSYYLTKYWARLGLTVHVYHPNQYKPEVLNEHFTAEELSHIRFIYVRHPQSIKFPGHYIYNSYRYSKALYQQVGTQSYDAVYAQGFTGWYFVKNQQGFNLLTDLHGIEMYQPAINIKNKLQHLLLRIAAKPIILKSHKQISLGGKLTDILYKQGAKANSVFEVPNAVAAEWITPTTPNRFEVQNVNKPVRSSKAPRRFIFIGRYERRKGIEEINQVITQMAKESQTNYEIHFVGPIPEDKRLGLEHRVKDLGHRTMGIGERAKSNTTTPNPITYHGTITHQQAVQQLLLDSDILLCPSYSEGMPTVILEAMACGCAIIATDVGASGELVNKDNGWLIKGDIVSGLKKAMLQAIDIDAANLQEMKENSMAKVKEKYTWDVVAKQSLEVLRGCRG